METGDMVTVLQFFLGAFTKRTVKCTVTTGRTKVRKGGDFFNGNTKNENNFKGI